MIFALPALRSVPLPSLVKRLVLTSALGLSLGHAETLGAPPPAGKAPTESAGADHARSRKPLAVVKDLYDKLGKGDLPGLMAHFAPDAKWILHGPAGIPFAGTHEGLPGIQAFFENFGRNAQVQKFELRGFVADKDQVVALGYEEAVAQPTGKAWKAHWTHTFTVVRGKIVLVEEVLDTAPVLAAFQP